MQQHRVNNCLYKAVTDNIIDKESEKFLCLLQVGGPFVRDFWLKTKS